MTDALTSELENDIIFGVYAPGTRIIEDRVMERYDVKRHAVRGAFAVLQRQGLLIHRPNRGVEVVEFKPDEIDALYDIRIILETAAAERTDLPCNPSLSSEMEDIANQHAHAVSQMDFRSVFALNQTFHRMQYSCCGNPMLAELIERHARIAQPIRVIKYEDRDHMQTVVDQHFAIIAALRGSSQAAYVQATRDHLPASAQAYRTLYERRFGKRTSTA